MRGAYARERVCSILGINEGSLRVGQRARSVLGLDEGSLHEWRECARS